MFMTYSPCPNFSFNSRISCNRCSFAVSVTPNSAVAFFADGFNITNTNSPPLAREWTKRLASTNNLDT